ncbi:hypothetical protein AB7282_06830, partial [Providencia huaxiensis]|uniref:hypothetical protein n=1 Tax=Providencia huaxiensis TaxID=2027290 RepID=UPI0032DB37A7
SEGFKSCTTHHLKAIPKQVIQFSKHSVAKPYLGKLVAGSARRVNPKDLNPARPTISKPFPNK